MLMCSISPRRTALNQTEENAPIRTLPIRLASGAIKVVFVNSGLDSSIVYKGIVLTEQCVRLLSTLKNYCFQFKFRTA